MQFYRRTPAPPLSEFVELLWLYEGYSQPHEKERLLPDGSMELVINLHEDQTRLYDSQDTAKVTTLPGAIVVGAHSEFFVIDTAGQHSVAGVHFKPGGAFPFFDPPASELHNRLVSLDDLWGALAAQLRERLLEAPTPQAKLRILEETLLAQAARRLHRHPAVAFALGEFHGLPQTRSIADVTAQIGLSAKRFIQLFSGEVGLTPKLFLPRAPLSKGVAPGRPRASGPVGGGRGRRRLFRPSPFHPRLPRLFGTQSIHLYRPTHRTSQPCAPNRIASIFYNTNQPRS